MEHVIFEPDYLETFEFTRELVNSYNQKCAIPIMLFKAAMDLETSEVYNYLINETCYDHGDFEDAFYDALIYFGIAEETPKKISEETSLKELSEETSLETSVDEHFFDYGDGKLYYDKETADIISRSITISKELNKKTVGIDDFLSAVAEKIPQDILHFLRLLGVDIKNFKDSFMKSKTVNGRKEILPNDLKCFASVMNNKYLKGSRCPILGRDKECEKVWNTMQKKTKRNVILVGEPGVGKSSVAKKITYDIVNGDCPEAFKDCVVISINVNSAIAGTQYRGQAEQRFEKLIKFLEETENIILFIDEIHTILGAGACREGEMDLANALKPILAEDKVRVIGATTNEEYEKYFSQDGALKRRFRQVVVKEPNSKEVYPMLKNAISDLSFYHNVKISKSMVEYIVLISSCFNHETSNPDRTIDLVDLSMVTAKNDGKHMVDKESVLKNFNIFFKKFKNMDYKIRKTTAYHEAGHYLVWKFSDNLVDIEGVAISIMPAEGYLGVTVFDELEDERTAAYDMDYFIDSVAMDLAGRVAEKMYTDTFSSGASADLKNATKQAYAVVARYGMSENFGQNRIYFDDSTHIMCSQKVIDNVNNEIDIIINKAYARAEAILSENEVYLKKLVNKLMRKGILSKKELDEIFAEKVSS